MYQLLFTFEQKSQHVHATLKCCINKLKWAEYLFYIFLATHNVYFPGKIDKLIIQPTNQSIQVGGAIFGCTIGNHVGYTLLYGMPALENVENLCASFCCIFSTQK